MKVINKFNNQREEAESLILQYCRKGRIVRYIVPSFNGITVRIKNCYSDKTWREHGSDAQNYIWQMAEACRKIYELAQRDTNVRNQFTEDDLIKLSKGQTPDGYTIHHAYSIGKDLIAQLVKTEEHKKIRHIGASYLANEKNILRDSEEYDISRSEQILNTLTHTAKQNPTITSALVGTGSAAVTYCLTKKIKNKKLRALLSTATGIITALVTNQLLTNDNVKYC